MLQGETYLATIFKNSNGTKAMLHINRIDHMQLCAYLTRNRAPHVINSHMRLAVAILSGKKK